MTEQEIVIVLGDMGRDVQSALSEAARQEGDLRLAACTGDGEELVRLCRLHRPNVVVMDLVLTGLDGLDVLARLKEMEPRPQVIITSTYLHEGLLAQARASGADYFLHKPYRMSTLLEGILDFMMRVAIKKDDVLCAQMFLSLAIAGNSIIATTETAPLNIFHGGGY